MRTAILYNEPLPEDAPGWEASRDVLTQVAAFEKALARLGHQSLRLPFDGRPGLLLAAIDRSAPTLICNLCETINEDPLLAGHPAALLDLAGLPYTGSGPQALMLSTDKAAAKRIMRGAAIPTADFFLYDQTDMPLPSGRNFPCIAKPQYQDASIGIDQEAVFADNASLATGLERLLRRHGPLLVEEFLPGREFNVAVLGYPQLRLLPLAEIDFSGFPADLFPLVDYAAKWDEASPQFAGTRRGFPTDLPQPLRDEVAGVVQRCCQVFGLRDYARVDLRLDRRGQVQVLEVNANPCLNPDAGFAAAAAQAGLAYHELVAELLACAQQRKK
ncbi:MAG: hypothetical protein BWK76_22275 [Desulfobulbaceae bacterium A2]|nr:MAG: hypothetical protein BWK76_22275 [Desulfobulbaceae bacterium A2]